MGDVGIRAFKKLISSHSGAEILRVLLESRSFGADSTKGITYILWHWNLVP